MAAYAQDYVLKNTSGNFNNANTWVGGVIPPAESAETNISFEDGASVNAQYSPNVKNNGNVLIGTLTQNVTDSFQRDLWLVSDTNLVIDSVYVDAATPNLVTANKTGNLRFRAQAGATGTSVTLNNVTLTSGSIILGHPNANSYLENVSVGDVKF